MSIIEDAPPAVTSSPAARRRWRFPGFAFLVALLALAGLLMFLYPSTAAWFSQYAQSQIIRTVGSAVDGEPRSTLEKELERARDYNDALVGGATVGANSNVPTSDGGGDDAEYEGLLRADDAGAMARLRVPAIDADLPIYHGTSDATLAKGVGHLQGTSLPVGGDSQHSVLTAHRGLATSELFTRLDQVEKGDTFTVEVFGTVLSYRVTETRVVRPEDTESLYPQYGRDLVTLVTCTPLGINSHRILVTGERLDPTPPADVADAGTDPEVPGFPWWAVGLGSATLLLGLYVWRTGYRGAHGPGPRR